MGRRPFYLDIVKACCFFGSICRNGKTPFLFRYCEKHVAFLAVYAEMGRRPFYLDIVKSMLLFWHRVEDMPSDSLLYNALKCSKNVDTKSCSWYSSIRQLCSVLDINLESSSQSKFKFKKIIKKNSDRTFLDKNTHLES